MTATTILAKHFTELTWDDIPADQIAQLKRFLLDYIGVALSGSQASSGRIARGFVTELGGEPQASVIGQSGPRIPALNAAFANAISEHSIELDDVDELALFHYGPPILSAALAVAQWQKSTGRELLVAVMAACEMMARLSLATNNDLRDRGFHTTPTCGVFAATVAAGKLMGLTAEQLTSALGLAGSQSGGLMEMYGPSMQKRFNPGPAARGGITAAMLAQRGFTGTDTILEGERGFGAAIAGRIDVDVLLKELGETFPVTIEQKAFSSARPIHNGVGAALEVRAAAAHSVEEITAIEIRRHPDWADYHLNATPRTFHEAQMSLPFSVAVALVFGNALPEQYSDENLAREDVRRLSQLVTVVKDASLVRGVSCDMTVTYRDGSTVRSVVDFPKGSSENPMSPAELRAKFDSLAGRVLPVQSRDRIAEIVASLEDLHDVNELVELTAVAGADIADKLVGVAVEA